MCTVMRKQVKGSDGCDNLNARRVILTVLEIWEDNEQIYYLTPKNSNLKPIGFAMIFSESYLSHGMTNVPSGSGMNTRCSRYYIRQPPTAP